VFFLKGQIRYDQVAAFAQCNAHRDAMTGRSPTPLHVNYSTATAESVGEFLATRYALPGPIECSLLRRGFNDSFEVLDANGQRYVLRLSCRRTRGEADVASETEFLTYLDSIGVPVAAPVPAQDGALFTCGLLPEGRRPVVLFPPHWRTKSKTWGVRRRTGARYNAGPHPRGG
jgi:hypothetical protein